MKNIQNNFASCYKLEGRNDGTGKSERAGSRRLSLLLFTVYEYNHSDTVHPIILLFYYHYYETIDRSHTIHDTRYQPATSNQYQLVFQS